MQIKVHRGLEQIGGCITEISSNTSRVFIDMGQNLPGVGDPSTPVQDKEMVQSIFAQNAKDHEAVVYTHAHEDHVGLFLYVPERVPQYIGEGGKEMLLAKYELIKKGNELNCPVNEVFKNHNECDLHNEFQERLSAKIEEDKEKIARIRSFHTWKRTKPHAVPTSFLIGDIRITPFFNCHSIYDSYMFLIEADGQRIWHMGDYREHGYMGKGLMPTLKKYASNIDVLITEGTMLNRTDECIHETEVAKRMTSVMNAFKYVVVLASSTDIERLATVKEAAKKARKALYICNSYMRRTMSIFTRREASLSKGLFSFHPQYVYYGDDVKIKRMVEKGFVLISGVSNREFVEDLIGKLDPSETILIYSSWDGYYKDPAQVELNPRYKSFRESFLNVVDIHTSGHADRKTIEKVVKLVNPKKVICIHKEVDASL